MVMVANKLTLKVGRVSWIIQMGPMKSVTKVLKSQRGKAEESEGDVIVENH